MLISSSAETRYLYSVSKMNLEDFPTHKADLNCKGVFRIDLAMTGGELTGDIKGVGRVSYAGTTSRETIQTKGQCKVEQK